MLVFKSEAQAKFHWDLSKYFIGKQNLYLMLILFILEDFNTYFPNF